MNESKINETTSLKPIAVTSEDIVHFRQSAYEGLDNMFKRDIRRSNKLNKILTRLSDIKFDITVTESGLVVPLLGKKRDSRSCQS